MAAPFVVKHLFYPSRHMICFLFGLEQITRPRRDAGMTSANNSDSGNYSGPTLPVCGYHQLRLTQLGLVPRPCQWYFY
jgi:hypothetical protein